MRKYKTIFQVLSYIALYFSVSMMNNPTVVFMSGTFCFFVWSFNIYDKVKYRSQKYQDEIRFPTQNDSYFKWSSLILGSILTFGMIIWITLMTEFTFAPIIGLIAGLLILTNGIIDVPKGQLKIENSKLKSNILKDEIEITEIETIKINANQITISKSKNSIIKVDGLELNKKWISKITMFLDKKLNIDGLKITCG